MRIKSIGVALAIALTAPALALAERIELREKDMTAIDATRAYVLMTAEGLGAMQIFRRADQAESAAWEVKRDKAHQRAQKAYQTSLKLWQTGGSDPLTRQPYAKPQPVEANFYYKPPELSNFINVMGRRYIKDQDYILLSLKPGDYVFYTVPGEGTGVEQQGQCLCMGTIGFTAEAGKIVSVGRFSGMVNSREYRFVPPSEADEVPASLRRFGVTPAKLWAVGKLPNFNGSIVTRVSAVPGVLGYQRDVPLDQAGQPATGLR